MALTRPEMLRLVEEEIAAFNERLRDFPPAYPPDEKVDPPANEGTYQGAAMLKALPPSLWRVMYLIWQHGPLTVAEVHRMSPNHSLTTVATFLKRLVAKGYLSTALEPSAPAGGRPPERFYPRVDYSKGLSLILRQILADYFLR